MPKAPKTPRRRKAPNVLVGRRSSIMNTEQAIGANEMVDKYAEYADSLSPQLPEKQRTALLGSKVEELFDELFTTPAFQNAVVEGDPTRNTAAWFAKLKKKLSNFIASARLTGPLDAIRAETMTTIRRCLLLFRGEFSPRDVFIFKEKAAIEAEVERLKDEGTSLVGGALLNHVIKLLWTDEKKAEYADQADPTSEDIDANQELFSSLLAKGLSDILTRGLLGTALVKVSVATQNPTGDLTTTMFYEGFDSSTSKPITYSPPMEDADDWQIEADCIIPRIKLPMPDLPLGDNGLPLWPLINIHETSITQLESIVNHYVDAVWFHAVPHSSTNPCFPATEFADDPSKFLDTDKFRIPTSIPPAFDDIVKLAQYLERASKAGVPFHFLPGSEIAKSHLAARGEDRVSAGAGEEASLAQALGIFEPPELDAVRESQPPQLGNNAIPAPAEMGTASAPQAHDEDASTAKLPPSNTNVVGEPQPPQIDNDTGTTNAPSASAIQPPPAEIGAASTPQPPNNAASTTRPLPAQASSGLPPLPTPSVTANAMQPLDALVAAAAASLPPGTPAGTSTAQSSAALSTSNIVNSTEPTVSTVCFAGGLDALVAAAAASMPLPPLPVTTSSNPTTAATLVETLAVDATSMSTGSPQAPAPATASPKMPGKRAQVLQPKRQTRSSLRAASASNGSLSSAQSEKLPSQTAEDPPEGSKRKRLGYAWVCPLTGKVIENDELPDDARPTKKPKQVSSTYKENTLQGSESTKRHSKRAKKL
ncbi:hypothetical protein BKA70DRAFT_1421053 [Coprinopsis sp. MPI-PUGE-AT-0042]|nr:hypothetical protein BKA70DRAFT_1421053 [Coprinopsis sp. MPI-PUGE-AT-0042]